MYNQSDWLWHVLRKRLWFVLTFAAIVTLVAACAAVLRPAKYTAYAEILALVDDTEFGNLRDRPDYIGNRIEPADLESYRRLLLSQGLAATVIERLGLQPDADASWPGRHLVANFRAWACTTAKSISAGVHGFLDSLDGDFWKQNSNQLCSAVPLAENDLGTIPAMDKMLQEFAGRLDVKRDPISRVLTISYTAQDPVHAANIVSGLTAVFMEELARAQRETAQQAAAYLRDRAAALREELGRAERDVKNFQSQSELYPIGGQSSLEVRYGYLSKELASAEAELTSARAHLSQLSSKKYSAEEADKVSDASRDLLFSPVIADLRRQQAEVARHTAQFSEQYGPRHPALMASQGELKAIAEKIQSEIQRIVAHVQSEDSFAEERVHRIRQELAELEGKIAKASGMQAQLRELESRAQVARHMYEVVFERYQRASEQQYVVRPSARVITPARVPVEKSNLSGALITIATAMGALPFGAGIAFLLELARRGYEHPEEIESDFELPVLGALPYVRNIDSSRSDSSKIIYAEAVRRTAMRLIHIDPSFRASGHRVILVVSALPGEGKSTICVSLARQWATKDRRVILIDCDLRKAQPERTVPRGPAPGLIDLLTWDGADLGNIITQDPVSSLNLLSARSSSDDAFRLLSSQKMEKLMEELRCTYDFIVIDSPPILAVSDAIALAAMADDVIVVTKWKATPRRGLRASLRDLSATQVPIKGIVLNQVNLKKYARSATGDYLSYCRTLNSYYQKLDQQKS